MPEVCSHLDTVNAGAGNEDWIWVMAAGAGLGLLGTVYLRRRRDALRSRLDNRVDPPLPGAGQPSG